MSLILTMPDASSVGPMTMTFFAAAAESGDFSDKEYALYQRYSRRVLGAFNDALAQLRTNLPTRAKPTVWDDVRHALAMFLSAIALITRAP